MPQPTAKRGERTRAREILSYFVRNPSAADSLEGVVRWRLLEEMVHRTVDETHGALEWLVAEGYLIESTTAGSGAVFHLDPERRADAERFLSADPSAAPRSREQ